MTLMGQTIDLTVLGVMWALIAVAALAGGVIGAAWRDLSLRRRWSKTEKEFQTQLERQVSTRDAKILNLESQLSQSVNREGELRARILNLQAPPPPAFAVVETMDEQPQELSRHQTDESAEVI